MTTAANSVNVKDLFHFPGGLECGVQTQSSFLAGVPTAVWKRSVFFPSLPNNLFCSASRIHWQMFPALGIYPLKGNRCKGLKVPPARKSMRTLAKKKQLEAIVLFFTMGEPYIGYIEWKCDIVVLFPVSPSFSECVFYFYFYIVLFFSPNPLVAIETYSLNDVC